MSVADAPNGVAHRSVTLDQERNYYCRNCGRWLCNSSIPLGTPGITRFKCEESACRQLNSLKLGELPAPRVDRARWLQLNQSRRATQPTRF